METYLLIGLSAANLILLILPTRSPRRIPIPRKAGAGRPLTAEIRSRPPAYRRPPAL